MTQTNFKTLNKNLKIITSTSLFAYMHNNYLLAVQNLNPMLEPNKKKLRQIIWKIRAKQVILATGSFERPLVFDNNDRPSIMLANSASKYIEKHNLHLADNAIIFTNNDSAYQTAIDLHNSNTNVKCVVDLREESKSDIQQEVKDLGIKIYYSHAVTNTNGWLKINSVMINEIDQKTNKIISKSKKINCDLLCVSGGWNPNVNLFSQSRGKLIYKESDDTFVPHKSFQKEISIGACNGTFELYDIENEVVKKLNNIKNDNNYSFLEEISNLPNAYH